MSSGSAPPGAWVPYEAVIFDMDGVVTDTARLHAAAWKQLFDTFFKVRGESDPRVEAPFDVSDDYRRFVDGRSREDGIRTFLRSRGVEVPEGLADDPPDALTVHGMSARKQRLFDDLVRTEGVRTFGSTIALITRLRAGGCKTGLVTASRNAPRILAAAGIGRLFDVVVDGTDARRLGLATKPDPGMFLEAARRLRVQPAEAAVVEDAAAGVRAGANGGFALVVGVDRSGRRDELEAAGAVTVVRDLAELDLGRDLSGSPWIVTYEGFDPAHEAHREAMTTLGNGYLGTRGAAPEAAADDVHYPGTYLAGLYNRVTKEVQGRAVETEHMVNCPNWLWLDVRLPDGRWLSERPRGSTSERRELDLRRGILVRTVRVRDDEGHHTSITQRRLVSMARRHAAALETTIVAEDWSGTIEVETGIDGRVSNANVVADGAFSARHHVPVAAHREGRGAVVLEVETTTSHVRIATGARLHVGSGPSSDNPGEPIDVDGAPGLRYVLRMQEGQAATIDKVVAVATSRDVAVASPRSAVLAELSRLGSFEAMLEPHAWAWRSLWDRFRVEIDDDVGTSLAVNLHTFHLLQTLSPHTVRSDAGVPARGLHGEGYRGHVFWDELFVFPFLNLRTPALTRSLLLYRWTRLDAARDIARGLGLSGAVFPWQSGSDGREETPDVLFNPRSGRWIPDHSWLQRHVGLAVAYNAWSYYQVTGDLRFLVDHGAELLVEVARAFVALASHVPDTDRYDIAGVMGPDEYHDGYPWRHERGLTNNAYTNVLASWVLSRALDAVTILGAEGRPEVRERLAVTDEEIVLWEHVSRRLTVPFMDQGVIEQFQGYAELEELDWARYRERYGNIGRLDLILEADGDRPDRYKLSKQADVLMLFYLFSDRELEEILEKLGYRFDVTAKRRAIEYYLERSTHGSTLSRIVEAWVLARMDPERSWQAFRDALEADLDDTQGGTTGEGIHLGAMAASLDLLLRAYAGIETRSDVLWFEPRPPRRLAGMRFGISYREVWIDVGLSADHLDVALRRSLCDPIEVAVAGEHALLSPGERRVFHLRP